MSQAAVPGPSFNLAGLAQLMAKFMPRKTPSSGFPADNTSIREDAQTPPNILAMQDILTSLLARPRQHDSLNAMQGRGIGLYSS